MRSRFIPIDEITDGEREAWRALAAHAADPNPFYEPEFVLPAHRFLKARHVHLLVVEDGSDWIAALPVVRQPGASGLGVSAWNHLYGLLGTPLVHSAHLDRASEQLLSARGNRDVLYLTRVGQDGVVGPALLRAAAQSGRVLGWDTTSERAAIQRSSEPPVLSSRARGEMRRHRRRLEEAVGAPIEVADWADRDDAVDALLRLEMSGWKGDSGTALACEPAHRAFFSAMTRGFARTGRLQMLTLAAAGAPVAMSANIVTGNQIFCFKLGFDDAYRRHAPGVQLINENIAEFWRRDETVLDTCAAPDNAILNRLMADRRPINNLLIGWPGLPGQALRHGIDLAQRGRRLARTAAARAARSEPEGVTPPTRDGAAPVPAAPPRPAAPVAP